MVETAYHFAGGTAIFENQPFERRLRDVHAATRGLGRQRGRVPAGRSKHGNRHVARMPHGEFGTLCNSLIMLSTILY